MKKTRIVIVAVVAAIIGVSLAVYAGPREDLDRALVFLLKARATTAVQVKVQNLQKAKTQILHSNYSRGGHSAAAVGLIMQAIKYVNDFNLGKANTMTDGAMVKVRHAIQLIKQEAAAKAKAAGK